MFRIEKITPYLKGYDACVYCVGVPSVGKTEKEYNKLTYDLTYSIARTLLTTNKAMTFCYISAAGVDAMAKRGVMWAKVRNKLEDALVKMDFKDVYIVRPAFILPMGGAKSRVRLYNMLYVVCRPFYPILKKLFPRQVTNTSNLSKAIIDVIKSGYKQQYLDTNDINIINQTS